MDNATIFETTKLSSELTGQAVVSSDKHAFREAVKHSLSQPIRPTQFVWERKKGRLLS
jgi:hypothetical protein